MSDQPIVINMTITIGDLEGAFDFPPFVFPSMAGKSPAKIDDTIDNMADVYGHLFADAMRDFLWRSAKRQQSDE